MKREPLLSRASIASGVTLLAGLAGLVGVNVTADDQNTLVSGIVAGLAAVSVVGHYVAAWRARKHTTPVADPRTNDGRMLVPVQAETGETFVEEGGAVSIVDAGTALANLTDTEG